MTDQVDYNEQIPNNVDLAGDARVKKALEKWHPGYLDWWMDMGPEGFQTADVYLRTAVRVESQGRALGDASTTCRCRSTAGASCSRRRSRTGRSRSARTRASRPGRRSPASTAPCCAA